MKIAQVTLLVPDYDAGIRFYVDMLGFDLLEDTQLNPPKRRMRVAPAGLETGLLLAKADTPLQQAAMGRQAGGRVGFFSEYG